MNVFGNHARLSSRGNQWNLFDLLVLLSCCLSTACLTPTKLAMASTSGVDSRPNIILIMADDLGVEGLGCYGGTSYKTPNLDQLAEDSVRFTRAYSQPLCTPTRVQIMTGKYNHRNWKYFGIMPPNEKTFGHYMQAAGYETAIIGKWQLQSYDPPDFPNADRRRSTGMHPKDAGFDYYSLFHALHTEDKGERYANPSMLQGKQGESGALKTYRGKYGEDVWVQQISDFMATKRDKPVFVYYPMALPHRPFEPSPTSEDWDSENVPEENVKYITSMVEYMDTVVGRLLRNLEAAKLRENTIVMFYSDNGFHNAVRSEMADGRTISGGKANCTQTGFHVPLLVSWPGKIKPAVCEDIVDASDFVPTLLSLAQFKASKFPNLDGVNFAPRLFGKPGTPRDWAFFWYDPRPGWDKERFRRHVFAVNKTHKLFTDGRLFRLSDQILSESLIQPASESAEDSAAREYLAGVIKSNMQGTKEPPLVNAFGEPSSE